MDKITLYILFFVSFIAMIGFMTWALFGHCVEDPNPDE